MNDELAILTTRLDEPAPPSTLKATVMARIARAAGEPPAPSSEAAAARGRERPTWLLVVAGFAAVLAVPVYTWLASGVGPDVFGPRSIRGGLGLMSGSGPAALVLGLGLLVYIAGLFGPLRETDRR